MSTFFIGLCAVVGFLASGYVRAETIAPQALREVLERQAEMEAEIRELRGQLEAMQFKMSRNVTPQVPAQSTSLLEQPVAVDPYEQAQEEAARLAGRAADKGDGTKVLGTYSVAERDEKVELYTQARNHVMHHEYEAARDKFQRLLALNPAVDVVIDANFWIGETFFIRGQFNDAVKSYAKSYQTFKQTDLKGDSTKAPNALLQLVRSLLKVGEVKKADATLQEYKSTFKSLKNRTLKTQLVRVERELFAHPA